jgi:hypothetical protein
MKNIIRFSALLFSLLIISSCKTSTNKDTSIDESKENIKKISNSKNNLLPATENDLFLYKGMGASYLCIASKAGIEFPKAVGVASATYVQVIEGKHGGLIKDLGNEKLNREKLFSGAEFQIVTTALQYCPDSVPEKVRKKVDKILKENRK